jgi:hypothetical protein
MGQSTLVGLPVDNGQRVVVLLPEKAEQSPLLATFSWDSQLFLGECIVFVFPPLSSYLSHYSWAQCSGACRVTTEGSPNSFPGTAEG